MLTSIAFPPSLAPLPFPPFLFPFLYLFPPPPPYPPPPFFSFSHPPTIQKLAPCSSTHVLPLNRKLSESRGNHEVSTPKRENARGPPNISRLKANVQHAYKRKERRLKVGKGRWGGRMFWKGRASTYKLNLLRCREAGGKPIFGHTHNSIARKSGGKDRHHEN